MHLHARLQRAAHNKISSICLRLRSVLSNATPGTRSGVKDRAYATRMGNWKSVWITGCFSPQRSYRIKDQNPSKQHETLFYSSKYDKPHFHVPHWYTFSWHSVVHADFPWKMQTSYFALKTRAMIQTLGNSGYSNDVRESRLIFSRDPEYIHGNHV